MSQNCSRLNPRGHEGSRGAADGGGELEEPRCGNVDGPVFPAPNGRFCDGTPSRDRNGRGHLRERHTRAFSRFPHSLARDACSLRFHGMQSNLVQTGCQA